MTIEIVELALESTRQRCVVLCLFERVMDLLLEVKANACVIGRTNNTRKFH
jgi:hypothetical protein